VLVLTQRMTREQECDRILRVCGADNYELCFHALDVQFKLLHDRAQLLLGICGVLVSTSVVLMSAKLVVRSRVVHQTVIAPSLLIAGACAIVAAAIVVAGVLRIRWTTELPGSDLRAWIMTSLRYRDAKTAAYRVATLFLLLSMTLFQVAALLAWFG
jgi:hypothetical protein